MITYCVFQETIDSGLDFCHLQSIKNVYTSCGCCTYWCCLFSKMVTDIVDHLLEQTWLVCEAIVAKVVWVLSIEAACT